MYFLDDLMELNLWGIILRNHLYRIFLSHFIICALKVTLLMKQRQALELMLKFLVVLCNEVLSCIFRKERCKNRGLFLM